VFDAGLVVGVSPCEPLLQVLAGAADAGLLLVADRPASVPIGY
jgi:hypothetical protein